MTVREQVGERLILQGIPQFDKGIVLPVVVGAAFIAVAVVLFPRTAGEPMALRVFTALPFVVGVVIVGVVAVLLTCRERLELDRSTGSGRYCKWSILLLTRRQIDFKLEHTRGVTLAHRVEASPTTGAGSRAIDVWEARLLISKPCAAVVLATETTARGELTRRIAQATADHLGVTLKTTGHVAS